MSIEKVFAERANLIPETKRKEVLEAFVFTLPSVLSFTYSKKLRDYCDELEETVPQIKVIKLIPKTIRSINFDNNEAITLMYVNPEDFVRVTIEKYNEFVVGKSKVTKADTANFLFDAIIDATNHFLNEIVEGVR